MITIDDARWIVRALDAASIARRTWRASLGPDGEARNSAALLDLETGHVHYRTWGRDRTPIRSARRIVLATTTATRREDVEAEARRGAKVAPSDDVIEEAEVRAAARRGLDQLGIERQLRRAYEILREGAA